MSWREKIANGAMLAALAVQTAVPKESLIDRLLRIAGLTAAPSQMRGAADDVVAGNIVIAALEGGTSKTLTTDGGYRSPVFSPVDGMIYALRESTIVRIRPGGGAVATVQAVAGVLKLVGFDRNAANEVVVLLDGEAGSPLGVASLRSGRIASLPYDRNSNEQQRMLAQIRAQDRLYGDTKLYTRTETKQGLSRNLEWTDVYIQRGDGRPRNVSACDGVSCAQPALSPDGRRVVFVKTEN